MRWLAALTLASCDCSGWRAAAILVGSLPVDASAVTYCERKLTTVLTSPLISEGASVEIFLSWSTAFCRSACDVPELLAKAPFWTADLPSPQKFPVRWTLPPELVPLVAPADVLVFDPPPPHAASTATAITAPTANR